MSDEATSQNCDNCHREPAAFMAGDIDGKETEVFWHVVEKQNMDPVVLLSSGQLVFEMCPDREHPILDDKAFLCADCFTALVNDE